MSATIIDGRAIAKSIREALKIRAQNLGRPPVLAVIVAGDNADSEIYIRNKIKACAEVGIESRVLRFPADVSQDALLRAIRNVNDDPGIDGLLVQSPLPKHVDERAMFNAIDPEKDVDGLHPQNAGALMTGTDGLFACTPKGCIELLKRAGVPLAGSNAVVLGRSNIVGKPMAILLLQEHCTVTVCHSKTRDLSAVTRGADILIAAIRQPRFVTGDMIKPGAAVIDVGINRMPDGKAAGDVDFESVFPVAGWITKVPGGVGPMTIAMLLQNTLEAAENAR